LAVSWVSADRPEFDVERGEEVVIRFRLSTPAAVSVQFVDPYGNAVRTLRQEAREAGEQQITWDGTDDLGNRVAPEAYAYTITASASVEGTLSEVTYDLRDRAGGEPVWPQATALDPKTGRITYTIPRASRVRIILSRQDTGWPVRTLLDWAPRGAGKHEESWDGWDRDREVEAVGMPNLIPIVYAFALPENVVRVKDKGQGAAVRALRANLRPTSYRLTPGSDRSLHHHSLHPRARCYDPIIEARFLENIRRTAAGIPRISRSTPLRLDIASQQPAGALPPIPRVSAFIFVDGILVERYLVGYIPYQWILEPARLRAGEHLITAVLAWRDDHFGIAHVRVNVEGGS
jgi:hypothetical protein